LLNKIYVKIPQVSQFDSQLGTQVKFNLFPITIDEAYQQIYELIIKDLISFKPYPINVIQKSKSEEIVLETKNLWYIYHPGVTALKDVNIKIHNGEFVAIIGQNGAGKTTLVKHFVGLLSLLKETFLCSERTQKKQEHLNYLETLV
ncbi:MAG: ATP-binding cassette domain-containing protein, partial [Candidatus Bathyarchaeia archaeon]